MNNLHRIFLAINLPEKFKKEFSSLQDRWLELPARWTKMENLHITLLFLGNANDQEVCDICKQVAEVAKRHDPFDVILRKITYGPPQKFPPRMVWVEGEKSEELGGLQSDLENALYDFSGNMMEGDESRLFTPHITLARLQQYGLKQMENDEIPQINEKIERTFMVESIEVMESELRRGGPVYTVLESVKLGE